MQSVGLLRVSMGFYLYMSRNRSKQYLRFLDYKLHHHDNQLDKQGQAPSKQPASLYSYHGNKGGILSGLGGILNEIKCL